MPVLAEALRESVNHLGDILDVDRPRSSQQLLQVLGESQEEGLVCRVGLSSRCCPLDGLVQRRPPPPSVVTWYPAPR